MEQPQKIFIRTFSAGDSGDLSVVESSRDLPFSIKRIYYIHGIQLNDIQRGFHAHKRLYQCMIGLKGEFELFLEGKAGTFRFRLTTPSEGVLIPPGYWREMRGLNPDTVLMVLVSEEYDERDYIRDYATFKAWQASTEEVTAVPYVDMSRYLRAVGKKAQEAIDSVFIGGRFINGPAVREFETQFAHFLGVRNVVGVGNGLDALTLILQAMNVGQGDEVIVCAAGFVATALAVTRVGACPVFVDCLTNGNIDPEAVRRAIGPKTRAILPTHLYGHACAWEELDSIAKQNGIKIIEDACQAHGARYADKCCGTLGDAAAFSFYPTKNLGAFGDGGCVSTNDDELAEKVRALANYGAREKYHHEMIGGVNSRLDELQAAVLLKKLPLLHEWNENRRALASMYDEGLSEAGQHLSLPLFEPHCLDNYHVYAVRVKYSRRDELAAYLRSRGIETNIHYPFPLHKLACYREACEGIVCPEAEALSLETLSLPLDAFHTQKELRYVVNTIRSFFKLEKE